MQCIGYWKENLKSYLITYDQLDAFTKYRCWVREYRNLQITKWHVGINTIYHSFCNIMLVNLYQVYQRADLNKMLMSMSVGPYCDLNQDVDSKDYKHGAVVSLEMDENERECKLHIYK